MQPREVLTAEQVKAKGPTEAEFTRQVLKLANVRGWLSAHFRPARTERGWRTAVSGDGAGFPDLILCRRERLVVAELKVGKNKPSPDQQLWITAWTLVGAEVFVWYPEHWAAIEETLL